MVFCFCRTANLKLSLAATAVLSWCCLIGCGGDGSTGNVEVSQAPAPQDSHAGHEHAHPTEGPHHGDLVELGNEEFHAEIVHGDAGAITVYILDGSAKDPVAIEAADITVNVSHDGHAEQFKLAAERESSDPEAKSSRFVLKDSDLAADLDSHEVTAKLAVTINGKSYSGKIDHHHDGEHSHESDHKH